MAALDHILWFHGDDHTTVGEGGIPSGKAHPIDHYLVVFRGSWDNESSWAHAEGMDASILDFGGKTIACGR